MVRRFLSYSQLASRLRLLFLGRVVTSSADKLFLLLLRVHCNHPTATAGPGRDNHQYVWLCV